MNLEISEGRELPAEETTGAKAPGWGCLIFTKNISEGALGRVKRAWGEMSPGGRTGRWWRTFRQSKGGSLALTLSEMGAVKGLRAEEWRDLTRVLQASNSRWRC